MEECKVLGIKQILTSYNNLKVNADIERYFGTYKKKGIQTVEEISFSELVVRTKNTRNFTTV